MLLPSSRLPWVERTLDRFERLYTGPEGLLVTVIDGKSGAVSDPEPLIADFGDVLPFLARFGRDAFVAEQISLCRKHLTGGLYRDPDGRILLFKNHDWLLGLLELHRLTEDAMLLDLACQGARTVLERFRGRTGLLDERPDWRRPRSHLRSTGPFNLGFAELFLELHKTTGDPYFLDRSREIAAAYIGQWHFRECGVFSKSFTSLSPTLDRFAARRLSSAHATLFKDNTNAVWALLALHQADADPAWRDAICHWIDGFERHFWNGGEVCLQLGVGTGAENISLKAAFPSIDLLCDLHAGGFGDRPLALAKAVADSWLKLQWDNGLFPECMGGKSDHLDCNTDMAVALMKLSGLTGDDRYHLAAKTTASSIVQRHEGEYGMILGIDADDRPQDERIIVKYQALALKLALLPDDPAAMLADPDLLYLLKDR